MDINKVSIFGVDNKVVYFELKIKEVVVRDIIVIILMKNK